MSACWFLTNVCTNERSSLTCVDPFEKLMGDDFGMKKRLAFTYNTNKTGAASKLDLHVGFSRNVLPTMIHQQMKFDIIYVDGSHERIDTFMILRMHGNFFKIMG
eukprot:TRINITY_DN2651_c0_g1_i1.p1 TRINITY_DN2651_c0_g1~~TRINITY_DN2651_c0_g1_i1.p1  ORF type:complete len:104 (-),score=12.26 TRINITY_DN2651_c0_g1_i1:274-585(-)